MALFWGEGQALRKNEPPQAKKLIKAGRTPGWPPPRTPHHPGALEAFSLEK